MPTQADGWSRHTARARTTRPTALTAASRLLGASAVPGQQKGTKRTGWQERCLAMYDLLGEIWFASQFYARSLEGLTFSVGQIGEDGKPTDATPPPAAVAELERIQMDAWAASFGRLWFLNGEGRLVGRVDENDNEVWDFMSVAELVVKEDGSYEWDNGYDGKVELASGEPFATSIEPNSAIVHRFWNPHPARSGMADCGLRAALDTAEELLMLTWATQARTKSRLAGAGILLIPEEITPPGVAIDEDGQPQPDEDTAEDPWLSLFLEAAQAAIADRDAAASLVPITLRVAADYIDKFKLIRFYDENDHYPEAAQREGTIKRLAVELDMPVEALLGIGDVNHWGAWQIDEQVWKSHVRPVADRLCADVTRSRIWPVLKGVQNATEWQVLADPSQILARPDPGPKAIELHDRNAISDAAVREANGFNETDAPTEEEPNTNPNAKGQAAPDPGGLPAQPGTTEPSPPPQEPPPPSAPNEAVQGAALVALHRCREAAGARLRTTLRGRAVSPTLAERLKAADNQSLANVLGTTGLTDLGTTPSTLVRETDLDGFTFALAGLGIPPEERAMLSARLRAFVTASLLDQAPSLPDGILWPESRR